MNPEDDPEARIRQLEQPLADAARASELGSPQPPGGSAYQGYPPPGPVPPPPPMPPPYGSTYGSYDSYGYQSPFPGPHRDRRRATACSGFWPRSSSS
ncbi:putative conserved membrane protein [Mycobacterium kansasii 824]|nr:putative conserved membrane protein [Mycobacterium kansasii 824]